MQGVMDMVAHEERSSSRGRKVAAHLILLSGIVSVAILMRVYALNGLFAPGADEGVYWQTLRAMHAGFDLYDQIFYSQPPLFVLAIYPFYIFFEQTIVAARASVAALSLLGFVGAYMMGKAIGGRLGAVVATLLLVFAPMYLRQSELLQAEGPSTAFLFLAVGAALLWSTHPVGSRAVILAIVAGASLSIGALIKFLNVTATVPSLMLVLWRVREFQQDRSSQNGNPFISIVFGLIAAVAVALIALIPFFPSFPALWDQVVSYHLEAKKVWPTNNLRELLQFFTANGPLTVTTVIGAVLAGARRDWRILPLFAWLMTTLALLELHVPLWSRHTIILLPPMIAMTVLGMSNLASIEVQPESLHRLRLGSVHWSGRLMTLLVCAAIVAGAVGSCTYYRDLSKRAESGAVIDAREIAADLKRVTTADQWIITDQQFIAALANRDTPPSLVDTSGIRITTGYLTTGKLIEAGSDSRVHAVVFASGRFAHHRIATFHEWVSHHFRLIRQYGQRAELWIR